jgi:hypothetical protein
METDFRHVAKGRLHVRSSLFLRRVCLLCCQSVKRLVHHGNYEQSTRSVISCCWGRTKCLSIPCTIVHAQWNRFAQSHRLREQFRSQCRGHLGFVDWACLRSCYDYDCSSDSGAVELADTSTAIILFVVSTWCTSHTNC